MLKLDTLNKETATGNAQEILGAVEGKYGFVPNLLATFAHSPAVLEAYTGLQGALDKTRLTPVEQQAVLIAISVENGCEYCVPAHSTVAGMVGVEAGILAELRAGAKVSDPKLDALVTFVRAVVRAQGRVSQDTVDAFFAAGYDKTHVLEVITGVALKTISNYTNHIFDVDLDAAFSANAWSEDDRQAA